MDIDTLHPLMPSHCDTKVLSHSKNFFNYSHTNSGRDVSTYTTKHDREKKRSRGDYRPCAQDQGHYKLQTWWHVFYLCKSHTEDCVQGWTTETHCYCCGSKRKKKDYSNSRTRKFSKITIIFHYACSNPRVVGHKARVIEEAQIQIWLTHGSQALPVRCSPLLGR